MDVHLTFDVEIWCDGWSNLDQNFAEAFKSYIYGPPPSREGALPLTLQILKDNGLDATFFVEPLFSFRFGLHPLQEIVGIIREAGQDVQLHVHPEWIDEMPEPLVPRRSKTAHLHSYSFVEQQRIIQAAAERLEAAGAEWPIAFRSGNYSMNDHTLSALSAAGIGVDSSLNGGLSFPYPKRDGWDHVHPMVLNGVFEYPITTFRDGIGRRRPLQVTACSTYEFQQVIDGARKSGLEAATVVSHNFELLTPDRRRVDRIARRRFENICRWLSKHSDDDLAICSMRARTATETQKAIAPLSAPTWATAIRILEQAARRCT